MDNQTAKLKVNSEKNSAQKRVYHFKDFTDELVENSGQTYALPEDYVWIRRRNRPILFAMGKIWASLYRICTGTKYVNRQILDLKEPYFIYANHTQPIGDILAPFSYTRRRVRLLAAPSNLGLPVLGPYLPDLGALPVPDSIHGLQNLEAAIKHYYEQGCPIIIYPEAHVWPYYTKIRPFGSAAFSYPVKNKAPVFTAVTTYQKRRFRKRPRRVIYFSGPFYPDTNLPRREQSKALAAIVMSAMEKSAKHNNAEYIKYIHDL